MTIKIQLISREIVIPPFLLITDAVIVVTDTLRRTNEATKTAVEEAIKSKAVVSTGFIERAVVGLEQAKGRIITQKDMVLDVIALTKAANKNDIEAIKAVKLIAEKIKKEAKTAVYSIKSEELMNECQKLIASSDHNEEYKTVLHEIKICIAKNSYSVDTFNSSKLVYAQPISIQISAMIDTEYSTVEISVQPKGSIRSINKHICDVPERFSMVLCDLTKFILDNTKGPEQFEYEAFESVLGSVSTDAISTDFELLSQSSAVDFNKDEHFEASTADTADDHTIASFINDNVVTQVTGEVNLAVENV